MGGSIRNRICARRVVGEEGSVVVRIASMSLRALFVINLILGLLFWFRITEPGWLVFIHMLVGILFVAAIWLLGLAQGMTRAGSLGLVLGTFVVGLIIAVFGLIQRGLLPTSAHWIIQVIHLLLAFAGIGIGEASAARYRRGVAMAASANAANPASATSEG
jgi:hypothetical protein